MGLTDRTDQSIVNNVTNEYKDAASWMPFSALEIKQIFSTPEELARLESFVVDMNAAANENEKKAALIRNITDYSDTVIKVLKLAKIVP